MLASDRPSGRFRTPGGPRSCNVDTLQHFATSIIFDPARAHPGTSCLYQRTGSENTTEPEPPVNFHLSSFGPAFKMAGSLTSMTSWTVRKDVGAEANVA